jgi:hypothetical protein
MSHVGNLAIAVGLAGSLFAAGNDPAEETALRKQIAAYDATAATATPGNYSAALHAPDAIMWSGAYKKPFMLNQTEPRQPRGGEGAIADRVPGSQKGISKSVRIVIADSKDLAYEYSTFTRQYTTKSSGKTIKFEGATLRVWQKKDGVWKVAAVFARPYEED